MWADEPTDHRNTWMRRQRKITQPVLLPNSILCQVIHLLLHLFWIPRLPKNFPKKEACRLIYMFLWSVDEPQGPNLPLVESTLFTVYCKMDYLGTIWTSCFSFRYMVASESLDVVRYLISIKEPSLTLTTSWKSLLVMRGMIRISTCNLWNDGQPPSLLKNSWAVACGKKNLRGQGDFLPVLL